MMNDTATFEEEFRLQRWSVAHWFLLAAVAIFALPSLVDLARREWSTAQGGAGPIILASGLWLFNREARGLTANPQRLSIIFGASLALILSVFVAARIVGMLWLEWLAAYLALLGIAYAYVGSRMLDRLWFPIVYLLFLVPPPYMLIAPITHSRKLWLSEKAVQILSWLGFDVAHIGSTLYIDQYELLVADACAGMNSLVSLLAIALFYVYILHRANWRYATLMTVLTIPVALLANLVRVLVLLLITHYAGITVAEGVLHDLAGLIMFLAALLILILMDVLLTPFRLWLSRQ